MRSLSLPSLSRPGRVLLAALVLLAASFAAVQAAQAVQSVDIYRNKLSSAVGRDQILQYGGDANCVRGGSQRALRVRVGNRTRECFFMVPVVGRDLQVSATGRLFESTPKRVRKSTYLAVSLRQAREGSRYQLVVYPSGARYQIRKVRKNGSIEVLKGGRAGKVIGGFGEANRMTLRAYNGVGGLPKSAARLVARVNGKRLAVVRDERGSSLEGRDTTFSIGSTKNSTGARGSFTGLQVSIPSPF